MKEKVLSNSRIRLSDDGIIIIYCKEDYQYELQDIQDLVEAAGELTGGKKMPTLTIPGKYTEASKEALDFIFSKDSILYASADAYIAQSLSQKIIGNFYLKIKKPSIPTRLFSNEKSALEWLKKFIEPK